MKFIHGEELLHVFKRMSPEERYAAGRKMREITDKMNAPCEPFNGIDVIFNRNRWKRWDRFPERFKAEREEYLFSHDFGEKVFVHGDLCEDNIIVSPDGEFHIIDFADAVLAPVCYERTHVAMVPAALDPAFLRGYVGKDARAVEIAEMCFDGILIHDFGGDIVKDHVGKPDEFGSLDGLHEKLMEIFSRLL